MMGFPMRKLVLIVAMSLLASQAYAGSRSLSLAAASATEPTTPQTPATLQAMRAPVTTPQPTVTTTTAMPAAAPSAPGTAAPITTTGPATTTVATKPKHREPSVESRVIRELHRHGIYW